MVVVVCRLPSVKCCLVCARSVLCDVRRLQFVVRFVLVIVCCRPLFMVRCVLWVGWLLFVDCCLLCDVCADRCHLLSCCFLFCLSWCGVCCVVFVV